MASVAQQVQLKIKLENTFAKDVKRIFNKILQDFRVSVARRGVPVSSRLYAPEWSSVLDTHYRRVQKAFTGVAKWDLERKQAETTGADDKELLALALLTWRELTLPLHTNLVTHTTQMNMSGALNLASEQFANENTIPSNREMALASTAILRRKFTGRLTNITMSETQAPAESTKQIEAEVTSKLRPLILGGAVVATGTKKTWETVGDERVRGLHQVAHGQKRSLTQPYIVGGEYLMHPGDTTMGAGVANTINCRCVSKFG